MCLTNECLEDYKEKLEKGIVEYMKMPAAQKTAEAVKSMFEALDIVDALMDKQSELTNEEIDYWVSNMHNADGSMGGHWSVTETSSLGMPEDMEETHWNALVNMMYSDYYNVANEFGINTPEFYCEMAKAFIYDEDAVDNKLESYYNNIVK